MRTSSGEFSKFGDGDGDMVWPTSIALDKDDNVYLADEALNRISIFDKDGGFLDKWGVPGSEEGQINKPSGIRFDADGNMIMVDSANHRVQKFTKDGKFLAVLGLPRDRAGAVQPALGSDHRPQRRRVRMRLAQRPGPEVFA